MRLVGWAVNLSAGAVKAARLERGWNGGIRDVPIRPFPPDPRQLWSYLRSSAAEASAHAVTSGRPEIPERYVQQKPGRTVRTVLTQVVIVQLISLAVLGWLQMRYGR